MKTRTRAALVRVANGKKKPVNLLRIDPSRTATLRRAFLVKLRRAWRLLRGDIVSYIRSDPFGLIERKPYKVANAFCPTGEGGGVDPSCSPSGAVSVREELSAFTQSIQALHARIRAGENPTHLQYDVEKAKDRFALAVASKVETAMKHVKKSLMDAGKQHEYGGVREEVYGKVDLVKEAIADRARGILKNPNSEERKDSHEWMTKKLKQLGDDLAWARRRAGLTTNAEFEYELTSNAFCPTGEGGGVDPSCGKDSAVLSSLKAAGATAAAVEHAVKDKIIVGLSKLPKPVQDVISAVYSTAFVGWTASQALAERVSTERGATAEESRRLRGVLAAADIATFKPAAVALAATGAGAAVTAASWVVPPATGAYLAYSTARDPMATYRAAKTLVKRALVSVRRKLHGRGEFTATLNVDYATADLLADVLEVHDYDDFYIALLSVALDEVQNVPEAIRVADAAYEDRVTNAFCPTGPGGGVDPSCSPSFVAVQPGEDAMAVPEVASLLEAVEEGEVQETSAIQEIFQAVSDASKRQMLITKSGKLSAAASYTVDAATDSLRIFHMGSIEKGAGTSLVRRLHKLRKSVIADNVVDSAKSFYEKLGFKPIAGTKDYVLTRNVITNAREYEFSSDPEKVKAFQAWLKKQIKVRVTADSERKLWEAYAMQGYRKGAGRAFDDYRKGDKARMAQKQERYAGTREEFLRSAFSRPVAVEKVKLLAGRSFDDLENVTADMSTRMSRVLTDGLVEGSHPNEIADDLADQLDISEGRAELIARTEIIRAHAEGQLDSMELMGVAEVGAMVEFATAADNAVCPECEALEGSVYAIEDARGVIPVHPNCRCAWLPAGEAVMTGDKG